MLRLIPLSIILVAAACQGPAETPPTPTPPAKAKEEQPAAPSAKPEPPAVAGSAERFESPRAVYSRYAEKVNGAQWADAVAVFTEAGKTNLALSNFKALALLAGSQHPKQQEYKAVLRDFCQSHSLRCADERWNAVFSSKLREEANVTNMMSDVTALAKAKPAETYLEVMKLLQGVDANAVVPLDPTLSEVLYTDNTATGNAKRADGQGSVVMKFEKSAERGWMIVE